MPLGYGNQTFTTSADIGGGRHYTRFKGPLLLGVQVLSTAWPVEQTVPPHAVNVSTSPADMLVAVASTFGSPNGPSAGTVSTSAPAGLVYITMTSGAGNMMAGGSTANAPTGQPGGATGVAIVYDAAKKTLALYDPLSSAWLWPHMPNASAGSVIVFSASSS